MPEGRYLAGVWHPLSRIGRKVAPTPLTVDNGHVKLSMSVVLMAMPAMKMHKSDY